MTILLNPRVWIALALAAVLGFTHFSTYRMGKAVVRAEWDKDKAARVAQAMAAEQAARAREQQLVAERQKAEEVYVQQKRKAAAAVAGALTELDRLRDELAAPGGRACKDPAAPAGAYGGAGLESDLLGHCATALVRMAQEADRLETVVVGLQGYVKNVCQKQ